MQAMVALFLGWTLGANDAANCFGTAVSSRMVRWRTAALLIAVFALLGAIGEGGRGLAHLSGIMGADGDSALCATLAAALTVAAFTFVGLPVSVSHAVGGALVGVKIAGAESKGGFLELLPWQEMRGILLCWLTTPFGALCLALLLYPLLAFLVRQARFHFLTYDAIMRALLVLAGAYAAYALGANNVANVVAFPYAAGVFGLPGSAAAQSIALSLGAGAIGFGALTYSRRVMNTVGRGLVPLDAFSAFVSILAAAVAVHVYARLGVPVSTSHAVVGAVLGVGLLHGLRTVSSRTLAWVVLGWLFTPAASGALAWAILRMIRWTWAIAPGI